MHIGANQNTLRFSSTEEPTSDDARIIDAGLDQANARAAPVKDTRSLSVVCRLEDQLVGGAVGRTWGRCGEIQQLWVASEHRRSGVGRRLVQDFESAAMERGCEIVYLDTFNFQAPDFYRAIGYEVAYEIEGFPDNITKHLMIKHLGKAE